MRFCAITDRKRLASAINGEAVLRQKLRHLVAGWVQGGVDFIQIREKDLDLAGLLALVRELFAEMGRKNSRLLINLSAGSEWLNELVPLADGIHLPGKPVRGSVQRVRQAFRSCGRIAVVSVACHSAEDVEIAREEGADFVLFAPVFEKVLRDEVLGEKVFTEALDERVVARVAEQKQQQASLGLPGDAGPLGRLPGQGLAALSHACEVAQGLPVFAMGGITSANAADCLAAGAAGIAGIRLFAGETWRGLRER